MQRRLLAHDSSPVVLEACHINVLAGRGAHRALVGAACGALGSVLHHWRRRQRPAAREAALISLMITAAEARQLLQSLYGRWLA